MLKCFVVFARKLYENIFVVQYYIMSCSKDNYTESKWCTSETPVNFCPHTATGDRISVLVQRHVISLVRHYRGIITLRLRCSDDECSVILK